MRGSQGGWAGWGWGAGSPASWLLCREDPPAIMRWGARSPGQPPDGWIRANSTRSLLSLSIMGVGEGSAWPPATPGPALPPHVTPLGTPRGMAQSPAKGAAWFLLQQQFAAGEPQAVLT